MATRPKFEINGVLDTAQNCLTNLNLIADACGCFVTWDPAQGHWAVIINDVGTSVYSFNDNNIIGAVNVTGSGVNDVYNLVSIEFPHKDLNDSQDYIDLAIPQAARYSQELDNRLQMNVTLVNDPVQAQFIATRELKQSRLDKVINFKTDYTANGLKAGDLIDITLPGYLWAAKMFRIITIDEDDSDDGNFIYSITAQEYDPDVYSSAGLIREIRTKTTGIVPRSANTSIKAQNSFAQTKLALTSNAKQHGLELAFNRLTNTWIIGYKETIGDLDHAFAIINTKPIIDQYAVPQVLGFRQDNGTPFNNKTTKLAMKAKVLSPDVGMTLPVGRRTYPDASRRFSPDATNGATDFFKNYLIAITGGWAGGTGPVGAAQNDYSIFVNLGLLSVVEPETTKYIVVKITGYWARFEQRVETSFDPATLTSFFTDYDESVPINPVMTTLELWKIKQGYQGDSGVTITSGKFSNVTSASNITNSYISGPGFVNAGFVTEINAREEDVGVNADGDLVAYFVYNTRLKEFYLTRTLPADYNSNEPTPVVPYVEMTVFGSSFAYMVATAD